MWFQGMNTQVGWFKVLGTDRLYLVEEVDAEQAANVGCPAATHRILGRNGDIFGTFDATGRKAGQPVQVPGYSKGTKGLRAVFVSANPIEQGMADEIVIEGYLG